MMVAQHLRLDPYSFIFTICMSGTTTATGLYMDRILKMFGIPSLQSCLSLQSYRLQTRRRAGSPERLGIYRNLNTYLPYLAKRNAGRRRRDRKEGAQILESIYI